MRLFCRFLQESVGVEPSRISLRVNVYLNNGLSIDEIEAHWREQLELPEVRFIKHGIDCKPTSSSGLRKHKLPYGVCELRVLRSTQLVQHIFGAIQEYAGFDQPAWVG